MFIAVSGNPHSKQPFRDLWDKGWRLERRKDEASQRPQTENRAPVKREGSDNLHRPYRGNLPMDELRRRDTHRQAHQQSHPYVRHAAPIALTTAGVASPDITDRLVDRFNRRHQTRA